MFLLANQLVCVVTVDSSVLSSAVSPCVLSGSLHTIQEDLLCALVHCSIQEDLFAPDHVCVWRRRGVASFLVAICHRFALSVASVV